MKNFYFYFLENHDYYSSKRETNEETRYVFVKKSDNFEEVGVIQIPKKPGEKMIWGYRQVNNETGKATEDIRSYWHDVELLTVYDRWFYDLVNEANASLEKRDKLRKFFV